MIKHHHLVLLLLLGLLTACQAIEAPVNSTPTVVDTQPVSETAIITPTSWSIHPNSITATPTIESTPLGANPTTKPTYTPWPSPTLASTLPPLIRVQPNNVPDYINPLTGSLVPNPNLLDRLPIAIKVALFPLHSLPPAGISMADHVYEYYLEYGLTRLIAIFYGNDVERVGPVRSGRIFDAHVVNMYNAAFVFGGAYKDEGTPRDVYGYLEEHIDPKLMINGLVNVCTPYLCRDESISSYNNIFGNTHVLSQLITQRGIDNSRRDLATNYFDSLERSGQESTNQIFLFYSSQSYSYWSYRPGSKAYFRYQGISYGSEKYMELIDRYTGIPISTNNLVVLFVPHDFFYHSSSTEIIDIHLTGSGPAYLFQNGRVFEARWERNDTHKPIAIRDPSGGPLHLKPGTVFFQVMSTETTLTRKGQAWIFEFEPPKAEAD